MAQVRAKILLPERRSSDILVARAQAMWLNVDARKVNVSVARPFEVIVHGRLAADQSLPELWEDLPDVEVVELVEADD